MFDLNISVSDGVTPALARLRRGLLSARDLNEIMATEVAEELRAHLVHLDGYRHATAGRLGATPTGHYGRMARLVESRASDTEAVVTVPRVSGLARAFGDVTIVPGGGKKWLTIPAHASTYGRRAGELKDLKFVPLGRERAALMGRTAGDGKWTVFYWLKKKVVQKRDGSLLPSDELLGKVIEEAAIEYVRVLWEDGKEGLA